tara:strand:+ start:104 stop:715 length:612 start_codon:yes stop_codon:yes gene_type:complete
MDLSKNRNDIKNSKEIKQIKDLFKKKNIFKTFKNTVFGSEPVIRSKSNNNINYAGNILSVVISGLIVYYVMKLEYNKCSCSQSRKRNYIKYFNIVFSLVILGITSITYYNDNFVKGRSKKYTFEFDYTITFKNIFVIILFLGSIINVFCVYTYIRELKENQCECAMETHQDIYLFLYYYSLVQLLTLMFFMIVIMMSSLSITY